MGRLDGRIAVVSGAASGMGQGAALKLAQEGALIEILDRQDATETIALIREAGGEAAASLCDVTDEEQIRAAAQAVEARRGRIDI
ncbi:MAG TPA: SDR family oxidoreductase, partial [Burkholderiaceae bacterium]|nr:SDR family oxidoreductase [Burkholderiaceae bacterium]